MVGISNQAGDWERGEKRILNLQTPSTSII